MLRPNRASWDFLKRNAPGVCPQTMTEESRGINMLPPCAWAGVISTFVLHWLPVGWSTICHYSNWFSYTHVIDFHSFPAPYSLLRWPKKNYFHFNLCFKIWLWRARAGWYFYFLVIFKFVVFLHYEKNSLLFFLLFSVNLTYWFIDTEKYLSAVWCF